MKHRIGKRTLSVLMALLLLIGMLSAGSLLFTSAAGDVNGWEVKGDTSDKITLTANGSATGIAMGEGVNPDTGFAQLPNKWAAYDTVSAYAAKVKATLTDASQWLVLSVCWAVDITASNANGLNFFFSLEDGLKITRRGPDNVLVESVPDVDVSQDVVIEIQPGQTAAEYLIYVNDVLAYVGNDSEFAAMLPNGMLYSTGLTLAVGGSAGTAMTVDTNASDWEIVGDAAQGSVIGSSQGVGITFIGGDHTTVYAQAPNKFKNLETGLWGFDLSVPTPPSWAGLTLNWSIDGVSPALTSSGIYLSIEADGSEGAVKLTPKKMAGGAQDIPGAASVTIQKGQTARVLITGDSSGNIVITINDTQAASYQDASMNALAMEFPNGDTAGLTLSTGGGGAYAIVVKTIQPAGDKTALDAQIDEAEALIDSIATGDQVGQVSADAKAAFQAAIDAAQAVCDDNYATQASIDAQTAALAAAQKAFMDAVIKNGDMTALKASLAEAQALLARFTPESESYKTLEAAIAEAEAVSEDFTAEQPAIDSAKAKLDGVAQALEESAKFWTVDPAAAEGVSVTLDGSRTTISGTGDVNGVTNIYTPIAKKDNAIAFNVNVDKRAGNTDGIWQSLVVSSVDDVQKGALERIGLRLVFGGNFGNGEIIACKDSSETGSVQIGHFSFRENYELQFKLSLETRDGAETLVVRIDGLEYAATAEPAVVAAFKSDTILGYSGGNNAGKFASITIDVDPDSVPADVPYGEFVITGPAGTGRTTGATVEKDGEDQILSFQSDAGGFNNAMARTILQGPIDTLEYSVTVNALVPGDWQAFLLSKNLTWTGINSPALSMSYAGSDNTVAFADYVVENGIGSNTPSWSQMASIALNKRMRIKITLEGDTVTIWRNDEQVGQFEATDALKEVFASERIDFALVGSCGGDVEFTVSHINEPDPRGYESLEPDEFGPTDIYSLDESISIVDNVNRTIQVLKDVTVAEFKDMLTFTGDYTMTIFDREGREITDMTASALTVGSLQLSRSGVVVVEYTVTNDLLPDTPGADDIPDTGVELPLAAFLALSAGSLGVAAFRRRRK